MNINLHDTFAVDGNTSILFPFLKHLEAQIAERNETERHLAECPNYYAWLSLSSNLMYYRIRELFYFNDKDATVFDWDYKKLIDTLFSRYGNHISAEAKDLIVRFAMIRHLMIHKGFPTYHKVPAGNTKSISEGILFTAEEVNDLCNSLQSPKGYPDLRASFYTAIRAIASLQRNEVIPL